MNKLIKSNIHKDRGILTTFLIIIIISAFVLQTGFFLKGYEKRYNEKIVKQHLGDGGFLLLADEGKVSETMDGISEVKDYTIHKTFMPSDFVYTRNDSDKEKKLEATLIFDRESYKALDDRNFVKKDESITKDYIYLSLYMAYYNGIKVGDTLHFKSETYGDYNLKVAGIYEDYLAGNPYSYQSVILDDETYKELKDKSDEYTLTGKDYSSLLFMIYTLNDEVSSEEDGLKIVNDALSEAGIDSDGYDMELAKVGFVSVVNIMAAFMESFSLVIVGICLIMIIFTINNNIDRDIVNIGALRAVGHTVAQVRLALCMEYLIIGSMGAVVGMVLSYIAFPTIEETVVRQISGLIWEKRFYPEYSLGILLAFIVVILVVVFLSTHKIKNLHPATALRFGLSSNSFKKNHLPLGDVKGNLNVLLALKSFMQSKGQNVIIFGVVVWVSFLSIFSGVLFYNTKIDMNNYQRLLQGDSPDAYIDLSEMSKEEVYDVMTEVEKIDGVTEVYALSGAIDVPAYVNGHESTLLYTDKPEFVYCGVYEGNMVKEDNEAVLGSITAEKAGVGVGDEVEVSIGNHTERFLVVGLQQAVYGLGERIYITDGGLEKLGVEPVYDYLRVRIEDPSVERVDDFISKAKDLLGSKCTDTENHFEQTRSKDNLPVYSTSLVVMVIAVINLIVIMVVIRLLLKSIFIKKEKEFGIKKAVGFTSSQLRLQLAISLLPTCIMASFVGAMLGHIFINPLFAITFSRQGIKESDLIMKPILIVISMLIVSFLIFAFSYIMSGRMKKVAAYTLIQE